MRVLCMLLRQLKMKSKLLRLDNLIMEAITNLRESGGSYKTTIATYIEMTGKYRMAPKLTFSGRRKNLSAPFIDGSQRICPKVDRDDMNMLTRAQIDSELANTRSISPQEAAASAAQEVAEPDTSIVKAEEGSIEALAEAAQAFAEADTVIAEAEEAAREVQASEADAEAAQALAEAAMKRLLGRSIPRM